MGSADEPAMVERVARAICAESLTLDWREYVYEARRAIAAMREPTGGMTTIGGYVVGKRNAKDVWESMIDAALKEPGHD